MSRTRLVALVSALVVSLLTALVAPTPALAVERNFAGSAQIDYHFVPTVREANASRIAIDGFTLEAALKLTVDFSDHLSANVKVCYGCHGFETDLAYFDYRVGDELNFRLGRFSPSFGNFNIRHDPANHRMSDKPLPYDMGRMLRRNAWNNGVLPSPFPDNGLEVNGRIGNEHGWMDYAVAAVSGFKADKTAVDLDFVQSRDGSLLYKDNNSRPSVSARVAMTFVLGRGSDATIGGSALHGNFDPDNTLSYTVLGGDMALRIGRTNLRLEYLVRRQEIDTSDPTRFRYDVPTKGGSFFAKHGAYVELEQPLSQTVDLALRADGMVRKGNVLALQPGEPLPADGVLDKLSTVYRYTVGSTWMVERGLMLKTSAELWQFSDKDAAGHQLAVGFHLAGVGTF